MKDVNVLIGTNLKRLREERGYSLSKLADIVQVSKSMLAQIEKGETNPSVGTIWKIANGLHVSFTSLLSEEHYPVKVIRKENLTSIYQEDHKYAIHPYFPYSKDKRFELYTVELGNRAHHYSEAHVKGVEEYFVVTEGCIEVVIGSEHIVLNKDDAITFLADSEHSYNNLTDESAAGVIVLYYNE